MKGFETSTDYEKLWDLIQDGYKIPAWILYSDKYDEPIYDLVEVKKPYMGEGYSIGTRGKGYTGMDETKAGMVMVCKHLKLNYVKPNEK